MADALKPFVENYTPMLVFSIIMLTAVLLTLPLILLTAKLKEWYEKKRGRSYQGLHRKSSYDQQHEDGVEYEVIEVTSRFIQVNPCIDLSDLYLAVSREMIGDSIDSLTEKSLIFDKSTSNTKIPDSHSFFHKRPVRSFSVTSQLATYPEIEAATQTFEPYYSDDQHSAWLPLDFVMKDSGSAQEDSGTTPVKMVTGRAARYQPSVSSNQIICPRRPSRDKFRSPNPCCCPEDNKPLQRTKSKCVIV